MDMIIRRLMGEYCEDDFIWNLHPLLSQYLPFISGRVFPGKEIVVEFLRILIERSINKIDSSEIQEWILWILKETYTLSAPYSETCEKSLKQIEMIVKDKQVSISRIIEGRFLLCKDC